MEREQVRSRTASPTGTLGPSRADGMYISQVAQILGVSSSVLRNWESERLVAPARTASGYRVFSVQDIERLRQIRDLIQRHGLNPAGVRRLLTNGLETPEDRQPRAGANRGRHVGERIQVLRRRKAISLRAVARTTGVSASSISAIERGLSAPSVGTLQRLAAALDTTVPKLLGTPEGRRQLVVRPSDRTELAMEVPGVRFENLHSIETPLQSMLISVEPGHGTEESYSHEGEEFLYVVQGEFEITLDELSVYGLGPGDAMTFHSTRPHRWRNPGEQLTITVWVNTPPTF